MPLPDTLARHANRTASGGLVIPEGMQRRTVDLPIAHLEALEATSETVPGPTGEPVQVNVSTWLAALVQLWVSDPEMRQRTAVIAQELSTAKLQRKQAAAEAARKRRWSSKESSSSG